MTETECSQKWMEKECLCGRMAGRIWGSLQMTKSMEEGRTTGQMAKSTLESLRMGNSMEEAHSFTRTA